jgi:hypothetical protein
MKATSGSGEHTAEQAAEKLCPSPEGTAEPSELTQSGDRLMEVAPAVRGTGFFARRHIPRYCNLGYAIFAILRWELNGHYTVLQRAGISERRCADPRPATPAPPKQQNGHHGTSRGLKGSPRQLGADSDSQRGE